MGQAKVVSGGPDGKYDIEIVYDTTRAQAQITAINKRISELPALINSQETIVLNARLKADADEHDLTKVIDEYNAGTKQYVDVTNSTDKYVKSETAWKAANDLLSKLRLEKTSLEMEKKRLEVLMATVTLKDVWCADKTQNIAVGTVVGTAELNGELSITKTTSKEPTNPPQPPAYTASPAPLIMPAGKAGQGKMQPSFSGTPAGTFLNWALLPWWQKRKPTYRAGVITSINYSTDKCSVFLFNEKSSKLGQGLVIIKEPGFDGWWNNEVPIEYMSCNASAFKVMDEVLVELTGQDWEKPKVIGFLQKPRACSLLVSIRFLNVAGNAEFISLANARIAQLELDKTHATYCKDVFIPKVISCYDNAVSAGIITTDIANWLKQAWTDWRDNTMGAGQNIGYADRIAQDDKAIAAWTMARNIASYAAGYLWGQYTGCLNSANESIAVIPSFVMNVDCDEATTQTAILSPTASTQFQREADIAAAAKTLWNRLDVAVSPICSGKIYVGGFCEFRWHSRGCLDTEGNFYFLTTNYNLFFYNDIQPPETTEVTIAPVGEYPFFRWPNYHEYGAMTKSLKGAFGTQQGLPLTVRVKGNLPNVPTDFGGAIKPLRGGDFMVKLGSSMNPVRSLGEEQGGPYATGVNTWIGRFIRDYSVIPLGFETFAGQYPTHPIVTGIDAGTPLSTPTKTLAEVNEYVNITYDYVADETNYDHWRFLGPAYSSGDCEDYAITKIQMLLDAGWSILRMKLQGGIKRESYFPKRFDSLGNEIKREIGHLWVLVDGNTVLDQGGGLKALADMAEWEDKRSQVGGLVWRLESTKKNYVAIPWPHTSFDVALMNMNATAAKKPL